jgi:hypothetical protein
MNLVKVTYGKRSPKHYIFKTARAVAKGDLVVVQSGDQDKPMTPDNTALVQVTAVTDNLSKLPKHLTLNDVKDVKGVIV